MQGNPLANRGKIGYDENINPDGTGGQESAERTALRTPRYTRVKNGKGVNYALLQEMYDAGHSPWHYV